MRLGDTDILFIGPRKCCEHNLSHPFYRRSLSHIPDIFHLFVRDAFLYEFPNSQRDRRFSHNVGTSGFHLDDLGELWDDVAVGAQFCILYHNWFRDIEKVVLKKQINFKNLLHRLDEKYNYSRYDMIAQRKKTKRKKLI